MEAMRPSWAASASSRAPARWPTSSARVRELAELLADRVEAEPGVRPAVARAAELCKADLVSKLVSEFSDLEGFAGSVYARQAGEPEQVCEAIREHHQPVEAGGALPATEAGALLAVADKVDTVAAAFASARSRPAAATPTACAAQPQAWSRSRWSVASSWTALS